MTGTRSASSCALCVSRRGAPPNLGPGCGYSRNPCALSRFIYFRMTTIVDNEKSVLRFVFLDKGAYSHHDIQVGVVRGYGKDVSIEAIILPKAGLEVF